MEALDAWLEAQERYSAQALLASVSATGLSHHRPAFGQTVRPVRGSVLASCEQALWDPEPDYFYHWLRDAAMVMLAARRLPGAADDEGRRRFADYVGFSRHISTRGGPSINPQRGSTRPDARRFLRDDAELSALTGGALLGEPRVNADGSADFERWGRPQFDGPALRAISCLAWKAMLNNRDGKGEPPGLAALLHIDLEHVLRHAAAPSIGPWEDEPAAVHAFVLLAQMAALEAGTAFVDQVEAKRAEAAIVDALNGLCVHDGGWLRHSSLAGPDATDANTVLGALLLAPDKTPFGVTDPRIIRTADHIEEWSRRVFPIATLARPLVGRWATDDYFGGHPWLPTSFGFAEYYFRRAAAGDGAAAACVSRGNAFLDAVRHFLPSAGPLPEQLHRDSGAPISCRDLSWSHAALIMAADARRAALSRLSVAGS
ncbi:MAG: glycoside hydrolase family 15 protein [Pseudomonadota bacterium]